MNPATSTGELLVIVSMCLDVVLLAQSFLAGHRSSRKTRFGIAIAYTMLFASALFSLHDTATALVTLGPGQCLDFSPFIGPLEYKAGLVLLLFFGRRHPERPNYDKSKQPPTGASAPC